MQMMSMVSGFMRGSPNAPRHADDIPGIVTVDTRKPQAAISDGEANADSVVPPGATTGMASPPPAPSPSASSGTTPGCLFAFTSNMGKLQASIAAKLLGADPTSSSSPDTLPKSEAKGDDATVVRETVPAKSTTPMKRKRTVSTEVKCEGEPVLKEPAVAVKGAVAPVMKEPAGSTKPIAKSVAECILTSQSVFKYPHLVDQHKKKTAKGRPPLSKSNTTYLGGRIYVNAVVWVLTCVFT